MRKKVDSDKRTLHVYSIRTLPVLSSEIYFLKNSDFIYFSRFIYCIFEYIIFYHSFRIDLEVREKGNVETLIKSVEINPSADHS